MKRSMVLGMRESLSKLWLLVILLLLVSLASSCSTINLNAAKALSTTGQNVATQAQNAASVSDDEIRRARESEAFLHGTPGTAESAKAREISSLLSQVTQELNQRAAVFGKLANLYEAFGELASMDYGASTEKALGDLGAAISEYAIVVKQPPPQFSGVAGIISAGGGLLASQVQKAKVKAASAQIRARDEAFLNILSDPLVKEQTVGFKQYLLNNYQTALKNLWDLDVYEPKPLLDDFGAPAGLVSTGGAAALVKSNPTLKASLTQVLQTRLKTKMDLVDRVYNDSIDALRSLIPQHKQLEQGMPVDLTRLRAIVAQLQDLANRIGAITKIKSTN